MGCKIYKSEKKGANWDVPEQIVLTDDTASVLVFGHPSVSNDELTLYFSSDLPGGFGSKDIWVAKRTNKSNPFGKPVNLGPTINTSSDEMYPYIHEDGTLYLSSNGHLGMGGWDIFKSEYKDGKFQTPENLKYPINTSADESGIIFEGTAEKGFYASNRKGGKGGFDIYSFVLPPLIYTLKGVIRDDSTKQVMQGALVELTGSDGSRTIDTTDATGLYSFDKSQILQSTSYTVSVKYPKYFSAKGKATTVGEDKSKDLILDMKIKPFPKKPVVLPDILYDLAKWDLKPQFQDSLAGLYITLVDNDNIVVELSSHTDIRGSLEYNDTLSQKRAQSCVDYLISKGIDPERMAARGYGERIPRTLDKDKYSAYNGKTFKFNRGIILSEEYIKALPTKDEQEAAHSLNRRTEFKILREDFKPTKKVKNAVQGQVKIAIQDGNQEEVIPEAKSAEELKKTKPAIAPKK